MGHENKGLTYGEAIVLSNNKRFAVAVPEGYPSQRLDDEDQPGHVKCIAPVAQIDKSSVKTLPDGVLARVKVAYAPSTNRPCIMGKPKCDWRCPVARAANKKPEEILMTLDQLNAHDLSRFTLKA